MRHSWLVMWLAACGQQGLEPLNPQEESSRLTVNPEGDVGFGEIPAGTATTRILTLQSDGESAVEVLAITFSEDTAPEFILEDVAFPITVEPFDIVPVEVYFEPKSAGTFNGQVSLDDGGRELTRRLIGFACASTPGTTDCE